MLQFNCVYGSSFSDVCLNTYGSLDDYVKLLNDNNLEPNLLPYSGQPVQWNETLIADQITLTTLVSNNIIYATLLGYGNPPQVNPIITMYVDPISVSYTATTDGETVVTIPELQGTTIVAITKEIKQLLPNQFVFNPRVGTIILTDSALATGESLFVLSKITVKN